MCQQTFSETTKQSFQSVQRLQRLCGSPALLALLLALGALVPQRAEANGGPFVIKYPGGDPAAKGVLARLDPSLMPAREERLKVLKEELGITFMSPMFPSAGASDYPSSLANVSARYFILNPTDEAVEMDFGFPILRGVYISPLTMIPMPDVRVTVKSGDLETNAPVQIISNSAIYGLIRSRAREVIDAGVARDSRLQARVAAVRDATDETRAQAREELAGYLRGTLRWNERDAALFIEFIGVDLGKPPVRQPPFEVSMLFTRDPSLSQLASANLGPLAAIGEQKATQLFAQLAGRFDAKASADYEAIFAAWGGDVRERSLDIESGELRPREYEAPTNIGGNPTGDPTLYARMDYLDENASLTDVEKASCKSILKNLPVTFTFAPMNLLYYRVTFAPQAEQIVTVNYGQYAYVDTRVPATLQVAYVVHPASLWKEFGPIELRVLAPEGVRAKASVLLESAGTTVVNDASLAHLRPLPVTFTEHRGMVNDKTGELFVAIHADDWREHTAKPGEVSETKPPAGND